MEIVRTVREMQSAADRLRGAGEKIGLVPTMGFLHQGHASLIRIARQNSDAVVTTIFVNPMQFGPKEDFERYPRDLPRDETLAKEAGTDILFCPEVKDMYAEGFRTYVTMEHVEDILEGKFRPGHFRGVTTVVAKLFNIAKPHLAVFGQKDAQQVFIVQKMAHDLNFGIQIVVAPIVREPDGLAMSSRNVYLNPAERSNATTLFKALHHAEQLVHSGERSVALVRKAMESVLQAGNPEQIDYIAFVRPDTFREIDRIDPPGALAAIAVRFGRTRLIDNLLIRVS